MTYSTEAYKGAYHLTPEDLTTDIGKLLSSIGIVLDKIYSYSTNPTTGVITISGTKSGGSNEAITLDLDTTANKVSIASTTGVTVVDLGTLNLNSANLTYVGGQGTILNDNNITVGDATENDCSLTFHTATWDGILRWIRASDFFQFEDTVNFINPLIFTPSTEQSLTAVSSTILANATIVQIVGTNNYTLTSTPTIADGVAGQILIIYYSGANYTITLQSQTQLATSNLVLGANTRALSWSHVLGLMHNGTVWVELFYR